MEIRVGQAYVGKDGQWYYYTKEDMKKMYKVRTTYKDHDLVTEYYKRLGDAIRAAREECMYSETEYSWVFDADENIVHKEEGWI